MLSLIFLVIYCFGFTRSDVSDYYDWSVDGNAFFPALPIAAPLSENEQCRKDSRLLMTHLKNKTYWAMQMWDASAKTDFGLLYGNVYQIGNFDECMLVKEPIEAQFCGVSMKAFVNISNDEGDPYDLDPDPYSIVWKKFKDSRIDPSKWPRDNVTWGICVPASCSWKDLNETINRHLQLLNSKAGSKDPKYIATISNPEWHCTKQQSLKYSWGEILFWITTAGLICIQGVAIVFDWNKKSDEELKESKVKRMLISFSLRRNLAQLFNLKPDEAQPKKLQVLHSLKFITMTFIIVDHRALFVFASPIVNFQIYEKYTRSFENLFAFHGDLLVDTFFFVGGLLSCYAILELYAKKFINPLFVIFGRWVRFAPLYYFLVWFHADGLMRLGSGPMWKAVLQPEVENCKNNWWLNLLFLNNYVRVENLCMLHTYYISCDIHLFVVCVFLSILIIKKEKLGISILGILLLVTTLIPGIITYIHRLKPLSLYYPDFFMHAAADSTFKFLITPTHSRANVYFIGMIAGYIIFKTKKSNKKLPRNCGGPLIILSLGLLFAPMAYGSLYYDPRRPYNVIESSVFASLRKFSWGLGCFICMMVHCFGKNIFLSCIEKVTLFLFLSKLTFSVYLVHFYMQWADVSASRVPRSSSMYDIFEAHCGDLLLSILYGITLYLLVELPFKKLVHELLFEKCVTQYKMKPEVKEVRIQLEPTNNSHYLGTIKISSVT